jgi:Na+/H+ antiporter NhaD and related arsenite permeases
MVASGTLTLDQAYKAVDLDTLTLLLGMMIIVAHLRLAGFFQLAAAWVGEHAHRPALLLVGVVLVSGLLSAFLVNDTVCLMLTPLVARRRSPCAAVPCPICWPSPWHRTSAARRPSPAIPRTS